MPAVRELTRRLSLVIYLAASQTLECNVKCLEGIVTILVENDSHLVDDLKQMLFNVSSIYLS